METAKGPLTFSLPDPQDIAQYTDVDAIDGMAAAQKIMCMVRAAQVQMIARLNQLRDGDRSVADEVAPELGISRNTAIDRVGLSDALLSRLPCTLTAMDHGEADLYKADKICDVASSLSDER